MHILFSTIYVQEEENMEEGHCTDSDILKMEHGIHLAGGPPK